VAAAQSAVTSDVKKRAGARGQAITDQRVLPHSDGAGASTRSARGRVTGINTGRERGVAAKRAVPSGRRQRRAKFVTVDAGGLATRGSKQNNEFAAVNA